MYDPTLPADNADLVSAVMRSQLTGLKDLIDAISTITAATIDSVTTGNPGDPASASVSLTSAILHFTFALPRGFDGGQGVPGIPGINGNDGGVGPQGPPFANAIVDGVTSLNPGDPATVGVAYDGTNVRFTFGIPRGNDGSPGAAGEVSSGQLGSAISSAVSSAIAGTSNVSNGVATLGLAVSDPPSQGEVQQFVNKLDELILALRR